MNKIEEILSHYSAENPGIRAKIWQILNHGALSGTGHLLIYPIDQGFEHGPDCSFQMNEPAYDPHYHFDLAASSGFSAFSAPVGFLESIANSQNFGKIPLILKINSANSLFNGKNPRQVVTSTLQKALQLGCIGIGITIYPGSSYFDEMISEIKDLIFEAKNAGLLVMIWSYPRGEKLKSEDETALDVVAYAAHIAALLGAHIIKIKPPSEKIFDNKNIEMKKIEDLQERIKHVIKSAFAGRRMMVFSGGKSKFKDDLIKEIQAIKDGGGTGSIVGRNVFQRNAEDAKFLIESIVDVYKK